jgi:protoheme IX farnesyltransferase
MPADATLAVKARRSVVGDYAELTKPRIALLVRVTTFAAMVWAEGGLPDFGLVLATLVGMACASGGGAVLNHVLDRDLDRHMERTRRRPVADGRVSPAAATTFGLALNLIAALILLTFTNVLTTVFAIGGSAFYVVIYTMLLKRRTPQNIVIGGAAGAIPPLAGWAAVTGEVGLAPLVMS